VPLRLVAFVFALAFALVSARAFASAFALSGVGPEGAAQAGALAARADGGEAAFYNPAGLAFAEGARIDLSVTYARSALAAQGARIPLEDPLGVTLTLAVPIPILDSVRLGLAAYLPTSTALHLVARAADEPFYPYYDNRSQRLTLVPAIGVRVTQALSFGAGLDILAGVAGPAAVRPGPSGEVESRIDIDASTTMALHLGLRYEPAPFARFALAFRQGFYVPAHITTQAEIGGVPLDLTLTAQGALYDPATFTLASSFDLGKTTLEIDAAYVAWSGYRDPFAIVTARLPGLNIASEAARAPTRDIVSLRGALTHRLWLGARSDLLFIAGAGAEPSVLTGALQGRTNLVDGDKLMGGLGATLALRPRFVRALRVSAGLGANVVLPSVQTKRVCAAVPCPLDTVFGPDPKDPGAGVDNPGVPRLRGGGSFFSFSLGLGVDL